MGDFASRYGPWALVAGGSEGLGASYSRELAARGVNLVLLALDDGSLDTMAAEIRSTHDVEVRTHPLDLSRPDLGDVVAEAIDGLDVGLLVYNAAASAIGPFETTPLDQHLLALDVNVRGPLVLARLLAPRLVARGRGGIILMASLASTQGTAMVATYSATKAFSRVLAEGLWEELGRHGVDVLAVTPGSTDTPTYRASEPRGGPKLADADAVARAALDGLGRGPVVVPGWNNKAAAILMRRILPRKAAIRIVSRVTRTMYEPRNGDS